MEREGLARKKAKSVTGTDQPTLFGFSRGNANVLTRILD